MSVAPGVPAQPAPAQATPGMRPLPTPLGKGAIWAPAAVFASISLAILGAGVNTDWFLSLNEALHGAPTSLWAAITTLGLGDVMAIAFFVIFARRRPDLLLLAFCVALLCIPVVGLAKSIADPSYRPLGELGRDAFLGIGKLNNKYAMPSGHTATAFAMAAVAVTLWRSVPARTAALTLAVAIGLSRIACGQHWPADVAMGAALGWLLGHAAVQLAHRLPLVPGGRSELFLRVLFLYTSGQCLFGELLQPEAAWLQRGLGAIGLALGLFLLRPWLPVGSKRSTATAKATASA